MKKIVRIVAFFMICVFSLVLFSSCGNNQSGKENDTETKVQKEKLIMATNASFPPYEFVGDDGNYAGIDVEIAGLIADKIGMELEIMDVEFGSIIGGVQSGKFSMGMAGMTVTEERLKSVNFSTSYAKGIQAIVVKEGSSIKSFEDIKNDESIIVGVQQDTTGDIYVTGDLGSDRTIQYKVGNDAIQALVSGKVDCVIIDNQPAISYVSQNPGLVILDSTYAEEDYAICFAKENTELLEKVNGALAELTSEGKIDEILAKYISA